MRLRLAFRLIVSTVVFAACTSSTSQSPKLTELQRTKSGDLEVVLLSSSDALPPGKSQPTLEFQTGADHHLVDVGSVKASATMSMPGMSPMLGSVFVNKTDTAGRYTIDADLGMTGTWRLTVEWDGPAGKGSASFPGTVR
jgi:hypothetical protein